MNLDDILDKHRSRPEPKPVETVGPQTVTADTRGSYTTPSQDVQLSVFGALSLRWGRLSAMTRKTAKDGAFQFQVMVRPANNKQLVDARVDVQYIPNAHTFLVFVRYPGHVHKFTISERVIQSWEP